MDAAFQSLFVALVTDDAVRARFLADPSAVAGDLPARAQAALTGIDRDALERYARSLKLKRWRGLAAIIGLTRRISPSIGTRYQRWLGQHPCPGDRLGLSPGESEGLRSLTDLRRALRADPGEAPWADEVLAFEVYRACSHRDGQVRQLRCRFALPEIISTLEAGQIPLDPPRSPHLLRFERHRLRWRAA